MPLYEYLCSKCGEKFEVIQKFSDTPLTVHEACGGTVERLISLSGFSLKGTGWYATDYAKSGSSSSPKKDSDGDSSKAKSESKSGDSGSTESKASESKSTESKSSETKTESKPAATTTKND